MSQNTKIPTPADQEPAGETVDQAQTKAAAAEVRENAKNSPSAKAKKLASKVPKKPAKKLYEVR